NLLDDVGQKGVARVAVTALATRQKIQRLGFHPRHQVRQRDSLILAQRILRQRIEIGQSRGMRQHLLDGDALAVQKIRNVLAQRIVELELAIARKLEDSRGREGLSYRSYVKFRFF